ncbi:MAG: 3-keto-disaccharide hydrolase [Pirellulales bacterium]
MRFAHLTLAMFVLVAAGLAHGQDAKPAKANRDEAKQGFVRLFDGKTLNGWQGAVKGYTVENGILVCRKEGGGNLFTAKEYANFVFRFEFKLEPGANNGVGIRAPLEGDAAYTAMEIQILDDTADMYKSLAPWQYHGSVYGVVPAKRGHLKPVGQWNSEEIACEGSRIKITLNGTVIVDADLAQFKDLNINGHLHSGLHREKGYIGFLGHGSRIEFCKIRIKELPSK